MEKFGQVNITTIAIGGVAILGIGYVLTTNNFFSSDDKAQVFLLVSTWINYCCVACACKMGLSQFSFIQWREDYNHNLKAD